jgi:hypothetical protein
MCPLGPLLEFLKYIFQKNLIFKKILNAIMLRCILKILNSCKSWNDLSQKYEGNKIQMNPNFVWCLNHGKG